MSNKVIIFGTGDIAEEVYNYLSIDSDYDVVAFTIDKKFIKKKSFMGKPVVAFENVKKKYPSKSFKMFIAIGYTNFNQLRFKKYNEAKKKGYKLISYISSKASIIANQKIGDNCLILENNSIQTTAKIGSNVFLWCNNLIGHHVVIKDNTYIAGGCVISGSSIIDKYCFIGVNYTITHGIRIGKNCFVGANTLINESLKSKTLSIASPAKKIKINNLDLIDNILK